MEVVKNITGNLRQISKPLPVSSEAVVTEIPIEKQMAMGDVIDRWRLNKGWTPYDNDSQDLAISSWVNVLDSEKVPAEAYNELFVRALKLRASLFAQGKQPPDMGIELMLACWESLRLELEERRINQGRTLGSNAASVCRHCLGSGFKTVKDGIYEGVVRCNHED